jgi:glycosyltransferase involved in cell wall biosynthesis
VRIAIVDAGAYTPPYDHHLASALGARGNDVHLLTAPFRYGESPRADGYRREEIFFRASAAVFRRSPRSRLRLPLKALEYVPGTARLRRRITELDPDVVHFQWLVRHPDVDLRWVRSIAARRATVLTAHDLWAMLQDRPTGWRRVFESVDRVVVHSRRGVDELARLGISRERLARIPHPVFDREPVPDVDPADGRTLLVVGVIRAYKGLDLVLRALPDIARRVPDVRLIVAGDPFDRVEPLRDLAGRLGVAERVEWRLGFHPDSEIDSLIARDGLVVLPYRRRVDSSGVLAMTLGRGRPVVASDVGSLGETVQEFGAGEVVPPEDVGALADACVRLLSDPRARAQAIRGALAARGALTWEASAELHERLYAGIARLNEPMP